MQSYEPPPADEELEDLTSQQAQERINAWSAGGLEHPWLNRQHPQHGDYARAAHGLFARIAQEKADAAEAKDQEYVRQVREHDTAANRELRKEAAGEMAKLVGLGFDEASIPRDIAPYQVKALKMQRLNAEGKVDELRNVMEKELASLRAPASTVELLRTYTSTGDLDSGLRENIFDKLISWIHDAHQQRHEASKPAALQALRNERNI